MLLTAEWNGNPGPILRRQILLILLLPFKFNLFKILDLVSIKCVMIILHTATGSEVFLVKSCKVYFKYPSPSQRFPCTFKTVTSSSSFWSALTQSTLKCQKYIKETFNLYTAWHGYSLILWQSFYGKRAKSLEKLFPSAWEMQFADFLEISGNGCANTIPH